MIALRKTRLYCIAVGNKIDISEHGYVITAHGGHVEEGRFQGRRSEYRVQKCVTS